MKHIFVINPASGVKNRTQDIIDLVKQELKENEYLIYETKGTNDATLFVKKYISEHPNEELRFYACGGDGTLNEVVNGAIGHENVEVTNYPIGSANDFLKYFDTLSCFSYSLTIIISAEIAVLNLSVNISFSTFLEQAKQVCN